MPSWEGSNNAPSHGRQAPGSSSGSQRRSLALGFIALAALAAIILVGPSFVEDSLAATTSKPAVVKGNTWFLRNSLTSGFADTTFVYGRAGTIPLMGDWDGNGTKTPGIVDGNKWYLRNSNTTGFADIAFVYGVKGDVPFVGDWDGDGIDTPGVVKGGGGCGPFDCVFLQTQWFLRNENSSGFADISFSSSYAVGPVFPTIGDWNNDQIDNPGLRPVFFSNKWYLDTGFDGSAEIQFQYGVADHFPIVGDWNGDGIDSAGVVSGNTWLVRNALTSGFADFSFKFGSAGDRFLVWQ